MWLCWTAVRNVWADVSNVSPSSEQSGRRRRGLRHTLQKIVPSQGEGTVTFRPLSITPSPSPPTRCPKRSSYSNSACVLSWRMRLLLFPWQPVKAAKSNETGDWRWCSWRSWKHLRYSRNPRPFSTEGCLLISSIRLKTWKETVSPELMIQWECNVFVFFCVVFTCCCRVLLSCRVSNVFFVVLWFVLFCFIVMLCVFISFMLNIIHTNSQESGIIYWGRACAKRVTSMRITEKADRIVGESSVENLCYNLRSTK